MSDVVGIEKITDKAGTGAPDFTNGFNIAGSDSGISPHKHTEGATEPSSPSNGDAWLDTDNNIYKVYIDGEWKDWLGETVTASYFYGDRLVRVGFSIAKNDIHRLDITTLGNAVDFKDLNRTSANRAAACSNGVNAYIFNGNGSANGQGAEQNSISYFSTSNSTNASDFGDSTSSTSGGMACSDATTGCNALGWTGSAALNTIDKITMATPGNATDFGDLTVNRASFGNSAGSNGTRGVFALGYNGNSTNTIDYITIATPGNATDFGDFNDATYHSAGYGSAAGGTGTGDRLIFATYYGGSKITYVTVSTTGNASAFGDTTITNNSHNFYCGAAANATRCIIQSGGYVGGGASNTIEYVTMATLGNASDFGDQATNEEQSHQVCTSGAPS